MLKALREKFPDKGVRKLTECLSNLPGKAVETVVKKPQCVRLRLLGCLAELEDGPDKKSLRNPESGDPIGYESDLGSRTETPTWRNKTASLWRTTSFST